MPRSTPEISSSVLGPVRVRLQRDVRHPLHRDVAGGVGVRAAVGPRPALLGRHLPVELVADQRAAGDDVELLLAHALVVVADGGQAVLDQPVAGHVHGRAAVAQDAQLVEGGERGAGVRRLVAQRPVQLGGVADRLVDGQEQVARVDDQVVGPASTEGAATWPARSSPSLGHLGVEVPAGARQVLPAAARRRRQRPHGGEAGVADVTAVSCDPIRTRCWVIDEPARSAKYLFSCT